MPFENSPAEERLWALGRRFELTNALQRGAGKQQEGALRSESAGTANLVMLSDGKGVSSHLLGDNRPLGPKPLEQGFTSAQKFPPPRGLLCDPLHGQQK